MKVTGTFADTINWAENASWGLEEALSGNKKAQDAFNKALEEGLPVEDAFNEALAETTSASERADIVAKFLNETYGESKKTYDETAESILDANEAELALKDTQAELGETMQPVNTALTDLKNQALEAITPLVQTLADAFMDLYTWLKEHPAVMHALVAVAIALASAFTVLAGALAIQGIITGVTKAMAFLNTTLLANPITLIIALITGLVAGFIYLWNNCDAFREFWIKLWKKIKEVTATIIEALRQFFTVMIPDMLNKVVNWFKSLPEKIRNAIVSAVEKVKTVFNNVKTTAISVVTSMVSSVFSYASQIPSKIWNAIQGAISNVASWGSSLASTARNAINSMISNVVSIASSIPGKFVTIGRNIIEGIKSGISGAVSGLYSSIKSSLSGLVTKAKNALGIHSPSRVFADVIGKQIPAGIAQGIDANTKIADDAVNSMTDDLIGQVNGATIERQLNATFNANTGDLTGVSNKDILTKLEGIYERLGRLQMVTDTGALVGEMIDKIDAGLATKQLLSARGV